VQSVAVYPASLLEPRCLKANKLPITSNKPVAGSGTSGTFTFGLTFFIKYTSFCGFALPPPPPLKPPGRLKSIDVGNSPPAPPPPPAERFSSSAEKTHFTEPVNKLIPGLWNRGQYNLRTRFEMMNAGSRGYLATFNRSLFE